MSAAGPALPVGSLLWLTKSSCPPWPALVCPPDEFQHEERGTLVRYLNPLEGQAYDSVRDSELHRVRSITTEADLLVHKPKALQRLASLKTFFRTAEELEVACADAAALLRDDSAIPVGPGAASAPAAAQPDALLASGAGAEAPSEPAAAPVPAVVLASRSAREREVHDALEAATALGPGERRGRRQRDETRAEAAHPSAPSASQEALAEAPAGPSDLPTSEAGEGASKRTKRVSPTGTPAGTSLPSRALATPPTSGDTLPPAPPPPRPKTGDAAAPARELSLPSVGVEASGPQPQPAPPAAQPVRASQRARRAANYAEPTEVDPSSAPAPPPPAAGSGKQKVKPAAAASGAQPASRFLQSVASRPAAPRQPARAPVLRAYEQSRLPIPGADEGAPHCVPTLWAEAGGSLPEQLLRGGDACVWGALRRQGALMLRVDGAWDAAQRKSALSELGWLGKAPNKLKSLTGDYQYIRQTIPGPKGFVEVVEDMIPGESLNGEYPFGALLDDVAENFRFAAEPMRMLGVAERELFYLNQLRSCCSSGLKLQFPYLQGLAVAAHTGGSRPEHSGMARSTPAAGAHAWDPAGLAVCPGSILPGLLRACEAVCNPALQPLPPPPPPPPPPPAVRDAARAAEELERAGAVAVPRNEDAAAARLQRRAAGMHHSVRMPVAGGSASSSRKQTVNPALMGRSGMSMAMSGMARSGMAAASQPPPAAVEPEAAQDVVPAAAEEEAPSEPGAGGVSFAPYADAAMAAAAASSELRMWGAGIVTPWLYFMGVCSTFAAHFEDYAFASANVIVAPPQTAAWVIWYSVPREALPVFHSFLRDLLGEEYKLDCLEQRRLWIDPQHVGRWNAGRLREGLPTCPVYRHVQGPGEYVVTDYGSVHWGVNLGVGWKSAVNFAFQDWEEAAAQVDRTYTQLEKETGQTRHYRCAPCMEAQPRAQQELRGAKLAAMAMSAAEAPQMAPLQQREREGHLAMNEALARVGQAQLCTPLPPHLEPPPLTPPPPPVPEMAPVESVPAPEPAAVEAERAEAPAGAAEAEPAAMEVSPCADVAEPVAAALQVEMEADVKAEAEAEVAVAVHPALAHLLVYGEEDEMV